jgi:hypothetical protein
MTLPKNLKIVSISLNKANDFGKWKMKTEQLHIEDSFLFVENESNKKCIKMINLNQIPRYILVDKNFKILEFDMSSPSEGEFETELKSHIGY